MRRELFLLFAIFQFFSLSAQDSQKITAKINIFRKDVFVRVDAVVENNGHVYNNELNYHLLSLIRNINTNELIKKDIAGEFTLLPNEKKLITSQKLNIEAGQELTIYLFIKNNDKLIARDSLVINESVKLLGTGDLEEDEIEIKGLVVENVKTIIGQNFYYIFHQKYSAAGTKYPFVIIISEKPFIGGRGSLITIEVGDDKIYEFQARPDEELLQKVSDYSLKLIENYSKKRKTFEKIY